MCQNLSGLENRGPKPQSARTFSGPEAQRARTFSGPEPQWARTSVDQDFSGPEPQWARASVDQNLRGPDWILLAGYWGQEEEDAWIIVISTEIITGCSSVVEASGSSQWPVVGFTAGSPLSQPQCKRDNDDRVQQAGLDPPSCNRCRSSTRPPAPLSSKIQPSGL